MLINELLLIKTKPIIYIKDPKKTFSVDYIYIKEDIKVEDITIVNIITINHSVRSNIIFIINLNAN
jgi:hypothetical protein